MTPNDSRLAKVALAVDNCDSFCDRVEMAAIIHHVPYNRDLAIRVAYEVSSNLHLSNGVIDHEKVTDDAIIKAVSERNKNLHSEVNNPKYTPEGK